MIVWIDIDHYFLVKYHNTCTHNHQPGEVDMRRFEPLPDVECKELYLQMPSSNLSQIEEGFFSMYYRSVIRTALREALDAMIPQCARYHRIPRQMLTNKTDDHSLRMRVGG
jgi:hypothetical protein